MRPRLRFFLCAIIGSMLCMPSLAAPPKWDINQALVSAAEKGDSLRVKRLLHRGAAINTHQGVGFITPLIGAVYNGRRQVVELLLDQGADPNDGDVDGQTPLGYAVEEGRVNIVRLLLEHGAKANTGYITGDSVLMCAVENGNKPIVRLLLAHKAPVNERDDGGETPLMKARKIRRYDLVVLLKKAGAKE